MNAERIALVGFMGAGKSTIGPRLGSRLGRLFLDLDQVVVDRTGSSIGELFEQSGEAAFRDLEQEVLAESLALPAFVISTGGGVVERDANVALLRDRCTVLWLDVRFETVRRRLSAAGPVRPLVDRLGWTGLRELHSRRRSMYAQCADLRLDADREAPARLVRRILGALRSDPTESR